MRPYPPPVREYDAGAHVFCGFRTQGGKGGKRHAGGQKNRCGANLESHIALFFVPG